MSDTTETSNQSFEQAISELEKIIIALEQGELPLDEALKQFEHAVKLSRISQEKLQAAEQKVQMLIAQGGQEQLTELSEASDAPGASSHSPSDSPF
ncbi:exodeoxyribonuclease VII small subunit [Aliidiomarina taiwanensis]|uniref:Exodeoxyribonuclease 7 small subunit n=1 Tax=Aliidiomarina taiwanensis TaxID=946228 RepID=A0A432X1F5_9GAMM|nr:exodeoxyribonuclease VII small subunit [Aliidiomarina taiwanensis]RUO40116.1 exodeoxyribonuclease VII small subunit [Aliidiomarina taiwanensis]